MKVPTQNMGQLRRHFDVLIKSWEEEMKNKPWEASFYFGKIQGVQAVFMNFNMVSDDTEVKLDMMVKCYPNMNYTLD